MADMIKIEIVSPESLVLSQEADSVSVPGQEGYFTVIGDHAPLMSILKPGFISVSGSAGTQTFYVQGGFADVSPEGVTILAEHAKSGEDFDKSEIETSISVAQEALNKAQDLAEKDLAQNVLDGWKNLLLESAQRGASGAH